MIKNRFIFLISIFFMVIIAVPSIISLATIDTTITVIVEGNDDENKVNFEDIDIVFQSQSSVLSLFKKSKTQKRICAIPKKYTFLFSDLNFSPPKFI